MNRWLGKVAMVTGANSGIGLAVCKDLVKQGLKVLGVDLNVAEMQVNLRFYSSNLNKIYYHISHLQKNAKEIVKTEGGEFYTRKCDVTYESEILDTFAWITNELGGVDVLVNSAGIIRYYCIFNLFLTLNNKIAVIY